LIEPSPALLEVLNLQTGYASKQVLRGVSMDIRSGEIVAVIGHNGAGKSTLLKAIFGLLPIWAGGITLEGRTVPVPSPLCLLREGVAYLPQGNRVFCGLTVRENLAMAGIGQSDRTKPTESVAWAIELMPSIESRMDQRAGLLSGGEKQVLTLANAMALRPRLLLLDEPSLGLSSSLVNEALDRVRELSRSSGTAILIVEQKVRKVLSMASRVCVLKHGRVTYLGPADLLHDEHKLRELYL
jgi:ABC-type branched-subunit amino acid transport system ATPase component